MHRRCSSAGPSRHRHTSCKVETWRMAQGSLHVSGGCVGVASGWVLTKRRVGGKLPGTALATQRADQAGSARGGDRGGAHAGCTYSQRGGQHGGVYIRCRVLLVPQGGCCERYRTTGLGRFRLITDVRGAWWRVAGS